MNNHESEPLKSPAVYPRKTENIVVADVQVHCSQKKSDNNPKKSENIIVADVQVHHSQNESNNDPKNSENVIVG